MTFDATFWVAVAFFLFFAATARPIGRAAGAGLRKYSAKIESDLAEAARLRDEAQALLEKYQQRSRDAHQEAERLMESARETVRQMEAQAAEALRVAVEARTNAAHEKIAREEQQAVSQVRRKVVDTALSAATALFEGELSDEAHERLIALAAKDSARLLH